jgi:hypothetical protein
MIASGSVIVFAMAVLLTAADKRQQNSDAELRIQLAQSQAALVAAQKERDTIRESLAKAAKDRAMLAAVLARVNADSISLVVAGQETTSEIVNDNAAAARAVAEKAASEAKLAAQNAAVAATISHSQNTALMVTQCFGFLAILTGFLYQAFVAQRDRHWARHDLHEKEERDREHQAQIMASNESMKKTIEVLENNTNSIKDALVKTTGEAEFAKGLKAGSESGKV